MVGFAAAYVGVFAWARRRRQLLVTAVPPRIAAGMLGGLAALGLAVCWAAGQAGMATTVYLAVAAVMLTPGPVAAVVVGALAVAVEVGSAVVPGWESEHSLTFAVLAAGFAMWGVQQLMLRNIDLLAAREENARLAAADERSRVARDLHDILGHSLTVITVKAELASRLLDVDPARARAELADLERLSRDALADVRRTVEGYRGLSLPGELARARQALDAAEIEADLPGVADEVPTDLRELFAWTVREGVTNVVRHSGARHCQVRLDARSVRVADDGRGSGRARDDGADAPGQGLLGLRERAAGAGAVVVTRDLAPGFVLEVRAR